MFKRGCGKIADLVYFTVTRDQCSGSGIMNNVFRARKMYLVLLFIPLYVGSGIRIKNIRSRIRDGKIFGAGIKHLGTATLLDTIHI
jgi:hypothetical protein